MTYLPLMTKEEATQARGNRTMEGESMYYPAEEASIHMRYEVQIILIDRKHILQI